MELSFKNPSHNQKVYTKHGDFTLYRSKKYIYFGLIRLKNEIWWKEENFFPPVSIKTRNVIEFLLVFCSVIIVLRCIMKTVIALRCIT